MLFGAGSLAAAYLVVAESMVAKQRLVNSEFIIVTLDVYLTTLYSAIFFGFATFWGVMGLDGQTYKQKVRGKNKTH